MNNSIIFHIDQTTYITLELEEELTEVHCCYAAPLFFTHNNTKIILAGEHHTDMIRDNIIMFYHALNRCLSNRYQPDPSIINIMGYMANEDIFLLRRDISWEESVWQDYNVWAHYHDTWLYNDADGNIIFELTPKYRGFYNGKSLRTREFNTWMRIHCKPYYKTIIPRDIAIEWVNQAGVILKTIEDNILRMHTTYEQQQAPQNTQ